MSHTKDETGASIRKTLALVFCDIVGFSRLIANEGDLVTLSVLREFYNNSGRLGGDHHCLFIKFVGDGFLAGFENMAEALPFVFSVQDLLSQQPTFIGRQLSFRFSLHVGNVLYVETSYGNDALGNDVNVVAYLNDLAQPDQIVVSHAAMERLPSEQQTLAGSTEQQQVRSGEVRFSRINLIKP